VETFYGTCLTIALTGAGLLFAAYAVVHTQWYIALRGGPLELLAAREQHRLLFFFGLPAVLLICLSCTAGIGLVGAAHTTLGVRMPLVGCLSTIDNHAEDFLTASSYLLFLFVVSVIVGPSSFHWLIHQSRRKAALIQQASFRPGNVPLDPSPPASTSDDGDDSDTPPPADAPPA
jgi:hypothetical protein